MYKSYYFLKRCMPIFAKFANQNFIIGRLTWKGTTMGGILQFGGEVENF